MTTPWDDYHDMTPRLTDPVDPSRDRIIGPPQPPVTLLEYGDYQCPFCGQAHQVVARLLQTAGDSVQYVFRHFPLTTVHPYAEARPRLPRPPPRRGGSGQCTTCCSPTSTRWTIRTWSPTHMLWDWTSRGSSERVHAPHVHSDFVSGVRSGVNGTPTFFINGVRHDESFDYNVLLAAVQEAMAVGADRH